MSTLEIRRNEDGSIDEVVSTGAMFHLEQLDDDLWYFGIYDPDDKEKYAQFNVFRKGKKVHVRDYEVGDSGWSAVPSAVVPEPGGASEHHSPE